MKQVTKKEFFKFIENLENLKTAAVGEKWPYTFECKVYGELIAKEYCGSYFIKE